ncbi:hypothetical protein COLO4_11627 [Corchorus olitorius]|uniref:Uncharacterized protein n=1 Tax=Corchorus olitorius TaxID=93759 RepID=A0A1R3K3T7_9ROSI|nr:hypothetical protein COLO4_11627 [Corchorus olitorius]
MSDFSGAEDGKTNHSSEEEDCNTASELLDGKSVDNHVDSNVDADGSDVYKPSPGDRQETMDDNQGDHSDGWLLSGDDSADEYWNTPNEQQTETSSVLSVQKDSQTHSQHVPHVKVSALTRVGLQELLEIIDDRLKVQDDKLKSQKAVENNIFDRKWRPPRKEEEAVAVDQ